MAQNAPPFGWSLDDAIFRATRAPTSTVISPSFVYAHAEASADESGAKLKELETAATGVLALIERRTATAAKAAAAGSNSPNGTEDLRALALLAQCVGAVQLRALRCMARLLFSAPFGSCISPPALFSTLRDIGLGVASGVAAGPNGAHEAAASVLRGACCRLAHHFRRGDLAIYSERQLSAFAKEMERVGRLVSDQGSPGSEADASVIFDLARLLRTPVPRSPDPGPAIDALVRLADSVAGGRKLVGTAVPTVPAELIAAMERLPSAGEAAVGDGQRLLFLTARRDRCTLGCAIETAARLLALGGWPDSMARLHCELLGEAALHAPSAWEREAVLAGDVAGSLLDLCQIGAAEGAENNRGSLDPQAAARIRYFALRAVLTLADSATGLVTQGTRTVAAEEVHPSVQKAFVDHLECGLMPSDGDAMAKAVLASWVSSYAGVVASSEHKASKSAGATCQKQSSATQRTRPQLAPELVVVAPKPLRHGGRTAKAKAGLAAILTEQVRRERDK